MTEKTIWYYSYYRNCFMLSITLVFLIYSDKKVVEPVGNATKTTNNTTTVPTSTEEPTTTMDFRNLRILTVRFLLILIYRVQILIILLFMMKMSIISIAP